VQHEVHLLERLILGNLLKINLAKVSNLGKVGLMVFDLLF